MSTKTSPRPSRRQFLGTGAATLATVLACPAIVRAQETRTFRISSWLPQRSLIPVNVLDVWADMVRQATQGRIDIGYYDEPLGPPPAHFELAQSGQADITYSLHGYSGEDAFVRARIGQFSFLGDAYSASHAFSKVYGELLDAEQEHEGVKVLGLFQHGPGTLMLRNREINTPQDFEGLRVRVSGGYITGLLTDLGAVPVPMPPGQVAQAFADGVIDAVAFPYEGADAFNVYDQVTNVSELPGGYYNASWFLAMNQQVWDQIPEADQRIVEQVSKDAVHVLAAKAFDYGDYIAVETYKERGTPMAPVSDEVLAHIREKSLVYERNWVEQLAGDGYDGQRALDYTRRITGVSAG